MYEVAIWSCDNNLLDSINELKMNGVEYGSLILDDASSIENITAYINLGATLIGFLTIALPIIVSKKNNQDNKTEVFIRTTEVSLDLKNLVAKYKRHIKVEIIEVVDKKSKD